MNIEIANRLAELRKQHGYSQEELAEKLGVSRQAISKWECGESSPDTDNLIALAKVYGMSLDELLGNPVSGKAEEEEVIEPEVVEPEVDEPDFDAIEEAVSEQVERKASVRVVVGTINATGGLVALLAYLLLGFLWKGPTGNLGWAVGWTLFLVPVIISTFIQAVARRSWSRFAYPILIVFVYCGMGIIGNAYGINLWHPYWCMFITIPIYYIAVNAIESALKKK